MYQARATWIGRVSEFNKQMFPLFPNVFVFFAQFTASYLILSRLLLLSLKSRSPVVEILVGSTSLMLFSYLFRCFDEVKDYESDKINFPDRPLVVGVMSLKDMYLLQVVVIVALSTMNLLFVSSPFVHLMFGAVLGFTILARFWFFAEKWIRPSLPLALLTHNPVVYIHQLYILSFFSLEKKVIFGPIGLLLVSIGVLGTAWEVSRKIRGIEQEDTYTTYSKVWGPVFPPVLVCFLLSFSWIVSGLIIWAHGPSWIATLWILPAIPLAGLFSKTRHFIKDHRKAPLFRKSVEDYAFATIIILFVAYFAL